MSTSSSVLAARRSPSSPSLIPAVTGCHHTGPQPCATAASTSRPRPPTSSSARSTSGAGPTAWSSSRRSTSPARSSRSRARSRDSGADRRWWPSTRRPGTGSTCSRRARCCARSSALPAGRYERMRVCDALLYRRGLPLYPVPSADQPHSAWQDWMRVGFELFAVLGEQLELYRPPAGAYAGRVDAGALSAGRLCETYPGRDLLRPARPPPGRQADAVGAAGADRGAQAQGDRRRGRRPLAAHARRAGRLRRGIRRLRPRGGTGQLGRPPRRGRDRDPGARAARPLRQAPRAVAPAAGVAFRAWER